MALILAFLAWLGLIEREPPPPPPPFPAAAAPATKSAPDLPDPPPPPTPLPPARGCREALASTWDPRNLPGRVDGDAIQGVAGLARLREAWGDALVVIEGGDFPHAPLRGARLRNFCFVGTNFADSDWREAETEGVGFIAADLSGAWLDRSRMSGLLLDSPRLEGATALGADWRGGVVRGGPTGSLKRVRLDGADLRGLRFDCGGGFESACVSYWGSISLRGADLRGASLDTYPGDADWTGARLGNTRVSLFQLTEIGPARRLGPLIVRAGEAEARLSPAEFAALEPFVHGRDEPADEPHAQRPSWRRPGATSLFVEATVSFDPAFRATSLYRRLVPVLAGNPPSRVLVTVRRDGRLDVEGDASGGGGHVCSLSGEGLRLDRATGWYSGPHRPYPSEPPEWRDRPMPVLRFRGDWAQAYQPWHQRDPRMGDYITCGARAGFGDMIRLPLTSAEARRWSKVPLR